MRGKKGRRGLLVLGLLSALALPGGAHGAYDPLGSGTTKLRLDPTFAAYLKREGIKLLPKAGAKRKGSTYLLSVSGGSLDPTIGKGEIDHAGTLVFAAAKNQVPLRQITLKTNHSPLIAKAGGGQLKVATSSRLSFKREGFEGSFTAKALALTEKIATRLNKKLRPETPFHAGQPLGTIVSKSKPQLVTIKEEGKATIVFDSAFIAKLDSHFVSLNPIFPAEHQGPSFSFPIALGGLLAPDGSRGTLRTAGALELLQLSGGQLFWSEPWLDLAVHSDSAEADLEPTPAFPGKVGRVGIFDFGAVPFATDPSTRAFSVSGMALTLSGAGAAQLNQAFGGGGAPFAAGEGIGVLGFGAQGQ
jgi:hypothetical protein